MVTENVQNTDDENNINHLNVMQESLKNRAHIYMTNPEEVTVPNNMNNSENSPVLDTQEKDGQSKERCNLFGLETQASEIFDEMTESTIENLNLVQGSEVLPNKPSVIGENEVSKKTATQYMNQELEHSYPVEETQLSHDSKSREANMELKHISPGFSKGRRKRLIVAERDSDEDSTAQKMNEKLSDSENEDLQMITENVESAAEDNLSSLKNSKIKHKRSVVFDSDDSDEDNANSCNKISAQELDQEDTSKNENKSSTACALDSSDDEICNNETNCEDYPSSDEGLMSTENLDMRNDSKDSKRKPKKMTGKEAAALKKEIQSESQRMVREMNVSLPYHKPKSFTIKEFLSRRPKFASAIPFSAQTPPSVAMKMSKEQLKVISEKLKEREKEVKKFYKSESESEDDDDKDYVPPNKAKNCDMEIDTGNEHNITDPSSNCTDNKNNHTDPDPHSFTADSALGENCDEANLIVNSETVKKVHGTQIAIDTEKTNDNIECHDSEIDILETVNDFGPSVTGKEGNAMETSTSSDTAVEQDGDLEKNKEGEQHPTNESEMVKPVSDPSDMGDENHQELHNEFSDESNNFEDLDDYVFNLDDLETQNHEGENCENSHKSDEVLFDGNEENKEAVEQDNNLDNESNLKMSSDLDDLDKEIENFNIELREKKLSKIELLKQQVGNVKPRLSGGPNEVIDLETGITKLNEVSTLMERFMRHTAKKQTHKNAVKLDIISIESGGKIHKETVAMNIDDDNTEEIEEKPGVKLQKLRTELQNRIMQRRSDLWQQKCKEDTENKEEDEEKAEKSDYTDGDDILDDDEEEEMTESSDEDEAEIEDKPGFKSAFVDDEAEESDIEEDGGNVDLNNEDDGEDADNEDEDNQESQSVDCEDNIEEMPKVKQLKRILRGFTEDSDDDDSAEDDGKTVATILKPESKITDEVITQDDDDEIPPHQPQGSQTPCKNSGISQTKSTFEFLTPISYITGLQNLNDSAVKSVKDSPTFSPTQLRHEPSPLKEKNWHSDLQKKLFTHSEMTDSQMEEIAGLCSGKFPESQVPEENIEDKVQDNNDSKSQSDNVDLNRCSAPTTTQDLLAVCSGGFTGISESQPLTKMNVETYKLNEVKEVKNLDFNNDIISQLINEDELEEFKKKFDSPKLSNTQKRIVEEFENEVASGGVIDSDDDDDILEIKRKKNKKRLVFSDGETSDDDSQEKEEEIDLHDEDEEDEDENEENIPPENIDYDSEENEIELTEEDNQDRKKLKMSDFFEREAELSESDWDSADEDEKDLDTMEIELGDSEKFDEKKVRSDLEKIHMRRMLDEDAREVKLLQELLLEDGELHGAGRERQFRWRNINSVDDENGDKKEEDDNYVEEEEESEEHWRKKRHEREMFLKEKRMKTQEVDEGDDELLSESQLLKIGHQVIQRSNSNSQQSTPVEKAKLAEEPLLKCSFGLLNKRGSFLSRNDQVLRRVAEFTKITDNVAVGTAKQSRSFLFQTVSAEGAVTVIEEKKKRKATDGTPNVIKKLRLTDNLSPANLKQKSSKFSARTKLSWNLD